MTFTINTAAAVVASDGTSSGFDVSDSEAAIRRCAAEILRKLADDVESETVPVVDLASISITADGP